LFSHRPFVRGGRPEHIAPVIGRAFHPEEKRRPQMSLHVRRNVHNQLSGESAIFFIGKTPMEASSPVLMGDAIDPQI